MAVGEDQDELAEEDEEVEDASAGKKRKRVAAPKKSDAKTKKAKLEKLAKSKKVCFRKSLMLRFARADIPPHLCPGCQR